MTIERPIDRRQSRVIRPYKGRSVSTSHTQGPPNPGSGALPPYGRSSEHLPITRSCAPNHAHCVLLARRRRRVVRASSPIQLSRPDREQPTQSLRGVSVPKRRVVTLAVTTSTARKSGPLPRDAGSSRLRLHPASGTRTPTQEQVLSAGTERQLNVRGACREHVLSAEVNRWSREGGGSPLFDDSAAAHTAGTGRVNWMHSMERIPEHSRADRSGNGRRSCVAARRSALHARPCVYKPAARRTRSGIWRHATNVDHLYPDTHAHRAFRRRSGPRCNGLVESSRNCRKRRRPIAANGSAAEARIPPLLKVADRTNPATWRR